MKFSSFDLSETQRRILGLLSCGKNHKQIGDIIGLSDKTIQFHLSNSENKNSVACKLGISTTAEFVKYAMANGLDQDVQALTKQIEKKYEPKIEIKTAQDLSAALLRGATDAANGVSSPTQINALCQCTNTLIELMRFEIMMKERNVK